MCPKKKLQAEQMSDALYVDQAAEWARALTLRESRGPGDRENAWRRLENRYGISFGAFWALRYRRPKDILTSVYFRLRAAYEAECERQMRMLKDEIAIAKAIAGAADDSVRAAQNVVDDAEGE